MKNEEKVKVFENDISTLQCCILGLRSEIVKITSDEGSKLE